MPTVDLAGLRRNCSVVRSGDQRKLFLIHPAGGTTVCYSDLFRRMQPGPTVYGIGYPAGLAARDQSIRSLARLYLALVRDVQPEGPYAIGGYSFGGNVAFEIALLLEADGERVDQLVMFDSHPPEAYIGDPVPDSAYLEAFPHLLGYLFDDVVIPPGAQIGSVADALEAVRRPTWSDSTVKELQNFFEVWRQNHQALKRYYPDQRLEAPVTIIAAAEPEDPRVLALLGIRDEPVQRWRGHLAGDLVVTETSGNHYSMFRDGQQLTSLAGCVGNLLGTPAGMRYDRDKYLANFSRAGEK
jgi:thioesterase domain-containing protein